MTLKNICNYLSDHTFTRWSRERDTVHQLQSVWNDRTELPLAAHTHPTSYRAGRLVVHADSSVWANRLRHQQEHAMQTLRQDPFFEDLVELRVRVAPLSPTRPTDSHRPQARLSEASTRVIKAVAADIKDPALKAALERLGARAGDTTDGARRRPE